MRKQLYSQCSGGEPQIIVEESTLGEEEAERRRNESPPRCLDPDSPSLNPYLLSPWRETRKHSLPTPQCTTGITASQVTLKLHPQLLSSSLAILSVFISYLLKFQVRRLSERGGEGSGPSPREAAFLATLSQAPAPQPGGRRHSVVTISKVPPMLFGRNRRESIAALPGATRILPIRRDSSSSGVGGPPSNSGSTHNLQLDIMDDIAEIKARKVKYRSLRHYTHRDLSFEYPHYFFIYLYILYIRIYMKNISKMHVRLKMWKTPSRERVCEVQPLEGNSSSQRYTQQQRRFSDFSAISSSTSTCSLSGTNQASTSRRRASEFPRSLMSSTSPGIVCSNTDLISILSSLTSSATEINRCGEERETSKSLEQKRRRLKDHRSNSFDVSILHGTVNKQSSVEKASTEPPPSSWFANRHQPMWKKQKSVDVPSSSSSSSSALKLGVIKTVKETLAKSSPPKETRHKVVWDDTSGTRVDAQVLGSAIEEFLTSQTSQSSSSGKPAVSPGKPKPGKVASWFSGGNKEPEAEACEPSICSSLKDLFVK
ncbi:GSCOCG00006652001-RA-CDS [Cotesia congregata]|nr:GSCOCG00006652001-RA-CDS [Cotesia congregata]